MRVSGKDQQNRPVVLMVGRGEPAELALRVALDRTGFQVKSAGIGEAVDSAVSVAPDLMLLVGDAAQDGGSAVLRELAAHSATTQVPVAVLSDEADPDSRLEAFRSGAVARLPRDGRADAMAAKVMSLLQELPERPGAATGEIGQATLDELVRWLQDEHRTGILTVEPVEGDAPDFPMRLVLGGNQPVAETVQAFVERVRPKVSQSARLQYEFREEAGSRLTVLDQIRAEEERAASDLSILDGLHVLLLDSNEKRAEILAEALRAHGALVGITAASVEGLEQVGNLDPEVIILDAAAVEGEGFEAVRRIRGDVRMRWASLLVVKWKELWPDPGTPPPVGKLATHLTPLLENDRRLTRRAAKELRFDTRLELTGPGRLLRALVRAGPTLHAVVRSPKINLELDLSEGLVVSAHGVVQNDERTTVEGPTALAALLALGSARVHVERKGHPSLMNIMAPADEALGAAAVEKPPVPTSYRPPAAPLKTVPDSDRPAAEGQPAVEAKTTSPKPPPPKPPPPKAPAKAPKAPPPPAKGVPKRTMMGTGAKPPPPKPAAPAKKGAPGPVPPKAPPAKAPGPKAPPPPAKGAANKTLMGTGAKAPPPPAATAKAPGPKAPPTPRAAQKGTGPGATSAPGTEQADWENEETQPPTDLQRVDAARRMAVRSKPPPPAEDGGTGPADGNGAADEPAERPAAAAAPGKARKKTLVGMAPPGDGAAAPPDDDVDEDRPTPAPPRADLGEPDTTEEVELADVLEGEEQVPQAQDPFADTMLPGQGMAPPPPPPPPSPAANKRPPAGHEQAPGGSAAEGAGGPSPADQEATEVLPRRPSQPPPRGSRRLLIAAAVALAAAIVTAAVWIGLGMGRGGDTSVADATGTTPAAEPAEPAATEPAAGELGTGEEPGAVEPGETEPSTGPGGAEEGAAAEAETEGEAAQEEEEQAGTEAEPPDEGEDEATSEEGAEPGPEEGADDEEWVPVEEVENPALESDRLVLEAHRLVDRGELDEAEANLDRAMELDPKNVRAFAGYAALHIARGNAAKALEHARKAVKWRRRRAPYHVLLGDALRMNGNPAAARRSYHKALQLDPSNQEARERLR